MCSAARFGGKLRSARPALWNRTGDLHSGTCVGRHAADRSKLLLSGDAICVGDEPVTAAE
jgi:hypothetical protein